MRCCPKCRVEMISTRKPFAVIDVCPRCGGVFLDAGEGLAIHGAAADASFLVRDGRAHLVRASELVCPSGTHAPLAMQVFSMGFGDAAIEFEHCPACRGVFLDHGEGAALEAAARFDREIETGTGARFSGPPPPDRHAQAVDAARAEKDRSFFEAFVIDCLRMAAEGVAATARGLGKASSPRRRRRRR